MPPKAVVPKRLPLASSTRLAYGLAPLVPTNEASVVIVLEPLTISNTVPSFDVPPKAVVPNRLPLASSIKPALGLAPLAPANISASTISTTSTVGNLEDRAVVRAAAIIRRTEEVAGGILDQPRLRIGSVRAGK